MCLADSGRIADAGLFARYLVARYERSQKELSWRVYVTDALYSLTKGGSLSNRWIDIVNPPPEIDPEQVIEQTVSKAGLVIV